MCPFIYKTTRVSRNRLQDEGLRRFFDQKYENMAPEQGLSVKTEMRILFYSGIQILGALTNGTITHIYNYNCDLKTQVNKSF